MASIRPSRRRSCLTGLYDAVLAFLEPLGLIERHAVQAPTHERHAPRQNLFQAALRGERVYDPAR